MSIRSQTLAKYLLPMFVGFLASSIHTPRESLADEIIEINFGYMPESAPIATRIDSKTAPGTFSPGGFCGRLYEYLQHRNYDVKPVIIDYEDRFKRFKNKKTEHPNENYGVECAASTITQERRVDLSKNEISGDFSAPFYSSEIAIMIKNDDLIDLKSGNNINVGVIGNTTTQRLTNLYKNINLLEIFSRDKAREILLRI